MSEHEAKPSTKFLSLNDDCIRSIFDSLSCDDLCALSRTCRRMLALGAECFKRNFSSTKVVIFKHLNHRGLVIEPKGEYYTQLFAEHVQNVVLDGLSMSTTSNLSQFLNFYRKKQCTNETARLEEPIRFPIKNLTLHRWFFDKNEPCGPLLETMLHNIESLTLSDCETNEDLGQCLLQYMPNLKRLTLVRFFNDEACKKIDELNDWMGQTYPNLEYFASHLESQRIQVDRIKRFQRANAHVQISLMLPSLGNDLQTWIDEGVRMDELFVLDSDFDDIGLLKAACERKQINRLHLRIYLDYSRYQDDHLAELTLLAPYIEGVYFEGGFVQKEPADFLHKIENLKILQADVTCNAGRFGSLPKLEQLFIKMNVDKRDKSHYSRQISRAINRSANLKKVFICGDDLSTLLKFSFRSLESNHKIKFFVKPVKGHNNRSNRPSNESDILRRLKKRSIRDEWTEEWQENEPIMIEIAHTESETNYNPIVGVPNFYCL